MGYNTFSVVPQLLGIAQYHIPFFVHRWLFFPGGTTGFWTQSLVSRSYFWFMDGI